MGYRHCQAEAPYQQPSILCNPWPQFQAWSTELPLLTHKTKLGIPNMAQPMPHTTATVLVDK